MVDNFELIKSLLIFKSEDDFYHLQIIRRGKDNPDMPAANRVIKTYYIDKCESLDKLRTEIIDLCEYFNARAYINLAPKSYRKCTLQCIADMAKRASDGDFKKIYKCWNSTVGYIKSDSPHWIVDIDFEEGETLQNTTIVDDISNTIDVECEPMCNFLIGETKIYSTIPTKHGVHLITKPFNLKQFKDKYPNIDVHKNNPTILYIP